MVIARLSEESFTMELEKLALSVRVNFYLIGKDLQEGKSKQEVKEKYDTYWKVVDKIEEKLENGIPVEDSIPPLPTIQEKYDTPQGRLRVASYLLEGGMDEDEVVAYMGIPLREVKTEQSVIRAEFKNIADMGSHWDYVLKKRVENIGEKHRSAVIVRAIHDMLVDEVPYNLIVRIVNQPIDMVLIVEREIRDAERKALEIIERGVDSIPKHITEYNGE
ncbi:hypothetical protein [Paenibacillus oryzisoli]|uniref:Uncharacterized protein n=1 Tax=Paenibacillus oryzisoli TaxID=1850517 RepID=A0A197ZX46_9BACL|nr:hypothetical protein [Paenibacillus oryzisoli]OAS13739.1 hypothetical protein A8708_25190 [Paenibacillus oryzisoli]